MENPVADLHIHSHYSHDSLLSPRTILRKAKAECLSCIAITDHGTIRGGIEARKIAPAYGIEVIVGMEIRTDCGDITGLGLDKEIHETAWASVTAAIKDQDGIVILPHPFRDHSNVEQIAHTVDLIECWNARSTPEQNSLAADLAQRSRIPVLLGSDAHVASEIGSVKMRIDRSTLECRDILRSRYSTASEIHHSQIISLVKQRRWGTLISQGTAYLKRNLTKNR
jgi:predicted metal-dependent phosphoesterase TrpH